MPTTYTFSPDYAVPPGATLKDVLESKGVSQTDLARRTGLAEKTISQIINGAAPISYDTAAKLELAIGIPARFWNSRESQYREALIRVAEAERLESAKAWLELIPVKELIERHFIQPASSTAGQVREVLKFFQVSSIEAWEEVWLRPQVQFRGGKAQAAKPGYVAAWIRMGEVASEKIECAPYDEKKFKAALASVRSLTTELASVWQPQLVKLCAEAGVAVAFVPEIPRAGVSGATKWVTKDRGLILLSLKFKSDDQFWFSFFHEACHVLRHSKKTVFFEDGAGKESPDEREADKFAGDILIPPQLVGRLPYLKSKVQIVEFAKQIGIAPGIVVGRMQHDGILQRSHCNDLKRKYQWSDARGKETGSA